MVLKRIYIGGRADLIIDVTLIHEFGGNLMANVSRGGEGFLTRREREEEKEKLYLRSKGLREG